MIGFFIYKIFRIFYFLFSLFSSFKKINLMKKYKFLLFILSFIFFSCGGDTDVNSKLEKQSYNITKNELLKKEQKNPQEFLSISGHTKKNIVGQTVVRGKLINKASVAIFKDVDIKLSFYSKTKTLLETDKETIFEILEPGDSQDFKTKYFAPKGTDSVGLEILGAKFVSQ